MDLSRPPIPPPLPWAAAPIFRGGFESLADSGSYVVESSNGRSFDKPHTFYFRLALAGWGSCSLGGARPQVMVPGKAILSLQPLQQHESLPTDSPGFIFLWVTAEHSYLSSRIAKQVTSTDPAIDVSPHDPLVASALRLVRGAVRNDFRDHFEAEMSLVELVLAFERLAQGGGEDVSEGQRLMNEVRTLILAQLPKAVAVPSLAAEFGMSRSNFSNFFREQTGLTPANFATNVRLQKAEDMLVETRAPLKMIADACGFANANHLCKVFRRLRYISPSAFRQRRR